MTELETKAEAEGLEFTDELCDELTDEALDRTEAEFKFTAPGTCAVPCR